MTRAVSNYTESSVDEAVLLNQELAKRQREYRIMENEKKQKCLEMENLMQKQKAAIKQLEKEQTEVATEMKLAASSKNQKQDAENARLIKNFIDGQCQYNDLIQKEKDAIKEVDREIAEIEHNIQKQRKTMGGVHNSHLRHLTTQHNIKVLENRLDKATREFNGLTADNKQLREEIQHLRNQRGVFDTIFKQLHKDMRQKKREQNNLIEKSALAYDQRDEAEQKMTAVKERDHKNIAQYQMEYKELLRQLDHDTTLKKFLLDKAEERWEKAEAEIQRRKEAFENRQESAAATSLNQYKKAFEDVRQITGAEEAEELIDQFVKMEDKNFALFNYVNEVNNQLQKTEDQIKLLERDIGRSQADSKQLLEEKSKTIEKESAVLQHVQAEMEESEKKLVHTVEVMEHLKSGIGSIFETVQCSPDAMKANLGDQSSVNASNVLQYLAEIESKTNELVQQYMLLSMTSTEKPEKLVKSATIKRAGDCLGPPSFDLDGDNTSVKDVNSAVHINAVRKAAAASYIVREEERKEEERRKQQEKEKQQQANSQDNAKQRKK